MRLRAGQPLLTGAARRRAWLTLTCCVILIAALGPLFAGQTQADGFDHAVDAPILAWLGGHQHLLLWLAAPATLVPAGVLSAIVAVGCLVAGRLNGAVLAVAAVPAAATINDAMLKPVVHRTYLGQPAFPSGHTAAISALAAMVVILVWSRLSVTALRVLVLVVAGLLVVVVGIAVIGLRWHYFTDTVAGAAVGIATVCGLTLIIDGVWGLSHGPLSRTPQSSTCPRWCPVYAVMCHGSTAEEPRRTLTR